MPRPQRERKSFDIESLPFVPSMNSGRALILDVLGTKGESRKPALSQIECRRTPREFSAPCWIFNPETKVLIPSLHRAMADLLTLRRLPGLLRSLSHVNVCTAGHIPPLLCCSCGHPIVSDLIWFRGADRLLLVNTIVRLSFFGTTAGGFLTVSCLRSTLRLTLSMSIPSKIPAASYRAHYPPRSLSFRHWAAQKSDVK